MPAHKASQHERHMHINIYKLYKEVDKPSHTNREALAMLNHMKYTNSTRALYLASALLTTGAATHEHRRFTKQV